jgi:hypothetical protein
VKTKTGSAHSRVNDFLSVQNISDDESQALWEEMGFPVIFDATEDDWEQFYLLIIRKYRKKEVVGDGPAKRSVAQILTWHEAQDSQYYAYVQRQCLRCTEKDISFHGGLEPMMAKKFEEEAYLLGYQKFKQACLGKPAGWVNLDGYQDGLEPNKYVYTKEPDGTYSKEETRQWQARNGLPVVSEIDCPMAIEYAIENGAPLGLTESGMPVFAESQKQTNLLLGA